MITSKEQVTKRILKALNEFYETERKIQENTYKDAELETIKKAVKKRLDSQRELYKAIHQTNTKHI